MKKYQLGNLTVSSLRKVNVYDDAEEEKISNRIMILDKALEEVNKELRGK